MSEPQSHLGAIVWTDLTVPNTEQVRDFYQQVVGWTSTPHDMGDYHDYNMHLPGTGECITGVIHARGINAGLPPQWLIYIAVESVGRSVATCLELGGAVVAGPRGEGKGRQCVISDPAGAVCVLYQTVA